MEIYIDGLMDGYLVRIATGVADQKCRSDAELKDCLRRQGVSEQRINQAILKLAEHSGTDRHVTLSV
jgi:SOS response regulatory protein OraA/RecX